MTFFFAQQILEKKVYLALIICNGKALAKSLCWGKIDTTVFVEAVAKLWNIVNIKSPNKDKRLNIPNRKQLETPHHQRLEYLWKITKFF